MSNARRIALVGGSGTLGSEVVRNLWGRTSDFKIILCVRTVPSGPMLSGLEYVKVHTYSKQDTEFMAVLRTADVLASFLGSAVAPSADPIMYAAAIEANVRLFVASEYTLDIMHPASRELARTGLMLQRLKCAERLEEMSQSSQTRCVTLSVGAFLDIGLLNGFLGFQMNNASASLVDGGVHKATGCTLEFVARVVARVFQMPLDHPLYQRMEISEVEYTGLQLLQALEKHAKSAWTREYVSSTDLERKASEASAADNDRMCYVNTVLKLNYDGCGAGYLKDGLIFGYSDIPRQSLDSIIERVVNESAKMKST